MTIISLLLMLLLGTPSASGRTPPSYPEFNYGPHFRETLDLYVPTQPCGRSPVVIFVPGGGWLAGDKSNVAPYVDSLLGRGFAIAAINHRLSGQTVFPGHIHDCKGAIRWLRANADLYNLDPNRFAMFGESSGGHLSALAGTSGDIAELEGEVGGNLKFSSRIQAVGDFYAPTDLFAFGAIYNSPFSTVSQLIGHPIQDILDNLSNPAYASLVALVNSANPAIYATADDPPFYISHGDNDTVVPLSFSQLLQKALVAAGVPSILDVVAGGTHEFDPSMFEPTFNFFAAQLIPARQVGDVNCDGVVDVSDLLDVINAWGKCPGGGAACHADVDGNGAVNIDDLLAVINHWS